MSIKLNRRLTLEEPQQVADGAGGFNRTWTALGQLWADIRVSNGKEVEGDGLSLSSTALKIVVRAAPVGAPSRPRPDQRFREGTRLYRILAVQELAPDGRYLTCNATEENVA